MKFHSRLLLIFLFFMITIILYKTKELWPKINSENVKQLESRSVVRNFTDDTVKLPDLEAGVPEIPEASLIIKSNIGKKNSVTLKFIPPSHDLITKNTSSVLSLRDYLHNLRNGVLQSTRPIHAKVDIYTSDILNLVDREHSGLSRSGFGMNAEKNSERNKSNLNADTLHVIVVPHSHSDPGWLKTLDQYFEDQTSHTLDLMVKKLLSHSDMTFVWAETVFLSMWWKNSDEKTRADVKHLIKRGQLEIVVGSWVVPDEACPHYYALIDQMILGHQWLVENLGVKPRNTWSLDPFGYSTMLPYLYKLSRFENLVILRVNSYLKKKLEERRTMEFYWRQSWDEKNVTDIFTLMMPYMLYNIKDSCGPDPKVCRKYDFRQIAGEIHETRAHVIASDNVMNLAKGLLDQYRKKASLYPHNVVLVPLGDDFRYDKEQEWDQQYDNYKKLLTAMNSHTDWNVNARFGTVNDYFEQVKKIVTGKQITPLHYFPSLSGDFFPYTDREDDYWTGYFTTRPFLKTLSRDIEVFLRSADILTTNSLFSLSARRSDSQKIKQASLTQLTQARQHLGLFQHHDAITGTGKAHVSRDYERRLNEALQLTKYSIRDMLQVMYPNQGDTGQNDVTIRVLDPINLRILNPAETVTHIPASGVSIVVYNNVPHNRVELIKLTVDKKTIAVVDGKGNPLLAQISPVWDSNHEAVLDLYELGFIVELPPLSLVTFSILVNDASDSTKKSVIRFYNRGNDFNNNRYSNSNNNADNIDVNKNSINSDAYTSQSAQGSDDTNVAIENKQLKAVVSLQNGQLMEVLSKNKDKSKTTNHKLNIKFMSYQPARSGAYIFSPIGPATDELFRSQPVITSIVGPVYSEIIIAHQHVTQILRVVNTTSVTGSGMHVENIVDIKEVDQQEVIMRVNTDISNQETFYTDQNGHHMVPRKRLKYLRREANYYPSSSLVYIEDDKIRMSVVSAQPLGVSSQQAGSIEIMLDRRLRYDDGRGMGEGVRDNRRVASRFIILIEDKNTAETSTTKAPTLTAHVLTENLRNFPVLALTTQKNLQTVMMLSKPLPCDVTLVAVRILGFDGLQDKPVEVGSMHQAVVILHRQELSKDYGVKFSDVLCAEEKPGIVDLWGLFKDFKVHRIIETSLTVLHDLNAIEKNSLITIEPNEIRTFKYTFN